MAGPAAEALIVMAAAVASLSVFAVVGRRTLTAIPRAVRGPAGRR